MSDGEMQVQNDLYAIEALLRKHGQADLADDVSPYSNSVRAGQPGAVDTLAGHWLWGGSGALWEVNLRDRTQVPDDVVADERQNRNAIIRLAEYLIARDIGSKTMQKRMRFIADTLKTWNRPA